MNTNTDENRFALTRFANVAHSAGSVLPFWLKLKENGLSILKPGYSEVQVTFIDDKCDIESLLKGECLDFCLDNGDHIKHGWRIDRKGKKWDLVILEIYEYFIKYSVTRVRD